MMKDSYGILLLDKSEIVLRVYQVDDKEWRLLHYFSKHIPDVPQTKSTNPITLIEFIIDFLAKPATQDVMEWKICSRGLPEETVKIIAQATGLPIENLRTIREQELLCKGMFTELW